jgi:hypothetical protein
MVMRPKDTKSLIECFIQGGKTFFIGEMSIEEIHKEIVNGYNKHRR